MYITYESSYPYPDNSVAWKLPAPSHGKSECCMSTACTDFSIFLTHVCCPIVHSHEAPPASCTTSPINTSPKKGSCKQAVVFFYRPVPVDSCDLTFGLNWHPLGTQAATRAAHSSSSSSRSSSAVSACNTTGNNSRATKIFCMLKLSDPGRCYLHVCV